ncbi:TPA: glycosyltransferase family 4 protein [Providencia alcalifaciens]
MKILHVSYSDILGGAARASYRLHKALLESGVNSEMMVRIKKTDDWTISSSNSRIEKLATIFRSSIGLSINNLQYSDNVNLRSGNWLPSNWAKRINSSDVDIVHMHWIGSETLSIKDIGKIRKPIVWTMHDMWPFCGAEHYTSDDVNSRWITGYESKNRISGEHGTDIDKLVWKRKFHLWNTSNMHMVSPSQWLANCAKKSLLFQNSSISVIPNPLDTEIYQPLNKSFCRKLLKLPENKNIILFGAIGGGNDPRKGYDLLIEALHKLQNEIDVSSTVCVIFGQSEPKNSPKLPFPTYWLGHINDDPTLSLLYNSANVMVVPSRMDNLPQTSTEAQTCGTPVVSFSTTGLIDIVEHKKTGYLAKPFDTTDLANGIKWILENESRQFELKNYSRKKAENLWENSIVANQYIELYKNRLMNPKAN